MSLALPLSGSSELPPFAVRMRLRLAAYRRLRRRTRARRQLAALLDFRDGRLREDVGVPAACRTHGLFDMMMPR